MKYLLKNTLAYFNSAPQTHRHDLSNMPTSVFAESTKIYRKECGKVYAHDEALDFYAANHCAAIIRKSFTPNESLPEWAQKAMDLYLTLSVKQGKRLLHYILSICSREMRHLNTGSISTSLWADIEKLYGKNMMVWLQGIKVYEDTEEAKMYTDAPPDVPIGKFISGLAYTFDKGKWSSGYGGKAWGNVAHACESFLHGKTTMEMLADTGYTLAHNGGPIFNKGMMYGGSNGSLVTILDVQKSGQIPELILDKSKYNVTKTPLANEIVELVHEYKPNEFKDYVDWFLVKKLGAVESYAHYEQKQKQLHPANVEEIKAVEKFLHGKKIKITGEWQVFPDQTVTTFERVSQ